MATPLEQYAVPVKTYLERHPVLAGLVVSAILIYKSNDSKHKVLLIQRAATDGFPRKWECPGGGVEDSDLTIIDAVIREIQEETGIGITRQSILEPVGNTPDEWVEKRTGLLWRKVTFLVTVEGSGSLEGVKLNPEEHQDFHWASEKELASESREDGSVIEFAYESQKGAILEGFRVVKELEQ
ncbi:NUDIX hydrolase domain-like protein [Podospora australis]|uniref:NUDIX hydrolase domain-like protein n=1 Tax=Podospora australis TaxID=1536484 RepID=A0AAN6WJD8_9PEZI|nr:NUDIX hydrolase domain-like protein [Podospora australis]